MPRSKVYWLPIDKVLSDHGVELDGHGNTLKALSPFRKSDNKNSFTVTISRNTFHDWKLDLCGGPVLFIEKLKGISEEEAVKYLESVYFGKNVPDVKLVTPTAETQKPKPLDAEVLDKAYRIFLSFCNLTAEDKKYLKKVRHLSDDEIEAVGFETCPTRTIRHELHKALVAEGIEPETVPGFFRYSNDEYITFSRYVGIIIPVRNVDGKIVGLQIRKREVEEGDARYVWFSSAFAINRQGEKAKYAVNGRSPESPVGFIPGRFWPSSTTTCMVTEGYFKALAINKNIRCPAFSVQGVTNWRGILNGVGEIIPYYEKLDRIVLAFDADFISNLNVSKQLVKMYLALKEKYPNLRYYVMTWDKNLGKGIDDLIENVGSVKGYVSLMEAEVFADAFERFSLMGEQLEEKGLPIENAFKRFLKI